MTFLAKRKRNSNLVTILQFFLPLLYSIITGSSAFVLDLRATTTPFFLDAVSDEDAMDAMERIEDMNAKLGVDCGATKERARLNAILEEWNEQQEEMGHDNRDNFYDEFDADGVDDEHNTIVLQDSTKFVSRHDPEARIAVFGGNPAKRRRVVEKKLAPYATLDQYGTPRDVGNSDTERLLRKIRRGKIDVLYIWTRFNCHASRKALKDACAQAETVLVEVESLSYIQ